LTPSSSSSGTAPRATDGEKLSYALGLIDHVAQIASNSRGEPDGLLRKIGQAIEMHRPRVAGGLSAPVAGAADEEAVNLVDAVFTVAVEVKRLRRCLSRAFPRRETSATGPR